MKVFHYIMDVHVKVEAETEEDAVPLLKQALRDEVEQVAGPMWEEEKE